MCGKNKKWYWSTQRETMESWVITIWVHVESRDGEREIETRSLLWGFLLLSRTLILGELQAQWCRGQWVGHKHSHPAESFVSCCYGSFPRHQYPNVKGRSTAPMKTLAKISYKIKCTYMLLCSANSYPVGGAINASTLFNSVNTFSSEHV